MAEARRKRPSTRPTVRSWAICGTGDLLSSGGTAPSVRRWRQRARLTWTRCPRIRYRVSRQNMIMKSEAAGRWGIGIIVGSLIECLAVNYSVGDQVKDEKETVTVALQDMGSKTEKCIQQDVRTDGPACQEAAAKAAEVKAEPKQTTVTV